MSQPGGEAQAPATVSTAFLGAAVASLMASECLRLLVVRSLFPDTIRSC